MVTTADSSAPERDGAAKAVGEEALCVVGVGASAGGLEAFTRLLEKLPTTTGMAIVLVSHLPVSDHSVLPTLLARATSMAVVEAQHHVLVQPNHVYVIPPNATMILANGRIELEPRARGPHMPIDAFFRALAIDRRSRAIGVVLSGTGSDGALGLGAIKAEGGITFAQDPAEARYDGMPQTAIAAGGVDFVRPIDAIAGELAVVADKLREVLRSSPVVEGGRGEMDEDLKRIFALLRAARGVDFTLYRHTTIRRRIIRRMVLYRMQSTKEYIQYLQERPAEIEALYQDILIKVTHFFRDPELFEALKETVFPMLLKGRSPDAPIRVWVPGCSTGEEPYSIAMCLLELLSERKISLPIQIFGTDVSDAAIERARAGVYLENIAQDVSPERLRRFFFRSGKEYRINKSIRDMCIFAKQDVTRDPPFSKLDLVSCRNVLIYFEPVLQRRVLPTFHYALKPSGVLVLGTSETVGGATDLFSVVDKRFKVYQKTSSPARPHVDFLGGAHSHEKGRHEPPARKPSESAWGGSDVQKEADRLVMSRYAPPGVIINADHQILQFRGHTGAYLEPAPGEASLNVLKMAREGLLLDLRAAIHQAKSADAPVRVEGVRVRSEGGMQREIAVEVIPLRGTGEHEGTLAEGRCYLILFEEQERAKGRAEVKPADAARAKGARKTDTREMERLQQELASTKEYLQAIIEEQEATNEELQSANEELLSSNEELQSINEELETAKEELQSTNEELSTVNDELENRNTELSQVNNDLVNLLASVDIPIVMLSSGRRIRRFTPQAEQVLNLIPSDIGRPISDIKPKIDGLDLEPVIGDVIASGAIREREVQDRDGRWYSMRVRPYRTIENKIDGVVICLVDIDGLKRSLALAGASPT